MQTVIGHMRISFAIHGIFGSCLDDYEVGSGVHVSKLTLTMVSIVNLAWTNTELPMEGTQTWQWNLIGWLGRSSLITLSLKYTLKINAH